eukprot:TRINITY_DN68279_c0_g1_i1.p1 TRINITY_DN68279_c0_g1~~TRINITY_DN68279_c0_g1_i1.p1  ORF type:complete len:148 (-),score=19.38 TRINITY_DN68279_c0_g1_i1:18-461(-)
MTTKIRPRAPYLKNEKGSPKRARRSSSSEDSMEAGGAQEVEASQEGDSRVCVHYVHHSYAVPAGVVPVPERALSPSTSSHSSVSSGVSLDELGTPPENEDRKDVLSGHLLETQEETVRETVVQDPLGCKYLCTLLSFGYMYINQSVP